MGEKTGADRTGSARERGIPVYVPTCGAEPTIIERAKIKGRFRLPIKRKWSKRAAPLYADRFVVILYLRLSIVLYRPVAEPADRFKRAAILYICGINAKLSFTYSGQKGASEAHSKSRTANFFVLSIEQSIALVGIFLRSISMLYERWRKQKKKTIFTSDIKIYRDRYYDVSFVTMDQFYFNRYISFLFWM